MASRSFNRLQALQKEIKHLHAKVNIGTTGAPTLVTANGASMGIASVVRDGQGLYTVTLEDQYVALVDFKVIQVASTAQDLNFQIVSEDMTNKEIKFRCLTAAVETDPAATTSLIIKIELKNTTAK